MISINKKINSISAIIFTLILNLGCNNVVSKKDVVTQKVLTVKSEVGKLNDYLKQFEEPSQFFTVKTDKKVQVKGKNGTVIHIDPKNLILQDGSSIKKKIQVELKELLNQEQLLRTNAQTTSEGRLLVFGGAYHINITSDGQQVKLKDGKNLSVQFPKISSKEMSLFYGKRDTLGKLNWQSANTKFKSSIQDSTLVQPLKDSVVGEIEAMLAYIQDESNKPLTKAQKKAINAEVYNTMEIYNFGWINCDRFYNIPNITNLHYTFKKTDKILSAKIYLVFKDINSLMQNEYVSFDSNYQDLDFNDIPIGANARLIAISNKNGKIFTYYSDINIKANDTIQLSFIESNKDNLNQLFRVNK